MSTPTQQQVMDALGGVNDPEIKRPITELGMVDSVEVADDGSVAVHVLLTVAGCPLKDTINRDVTAAVTGVAGVTSVDLSLGVMSAEQRAGLKEILSNGRAEREIPFAQAGSLTKVYAIASGKGGVGKSTVTANLAMAMALDGRRVGVIDADVYGFSIPRMLGVSGRPTAIDQMLIPLERDGIRVMSIGFLLPNENDAVIWRGPMLHKALMTFISEVHWGDDLEYLFIDLPPGTGDVSLSIAQTLPATSMILVTTPQPAAASVAERAAKMAEKVNMDVVGVIENMSGFAPAPGAPAVDLFGRGGGRELAERLGVPLLAEIPLDIAMREGADIGEPVVKSHPDSPAARALRAAARMLAERLPVLVRS